MEENRTTKELRQFAWAMEEHEWRIERVRNMLRKKGVPEECIRGKSIEAIALQAGVPAADIKPGLPFRTIELYVEAAPVSAFGAAAAAPTDPASPAPEATPHARGRAKRQRPDQQALIRAAHEYAMQVIAGANKMTTRDLHTAILEKLDVEASLASGMEQERLETFRKAIPQNPETFAKHLRLAGFPRYSTGRPNTGNSVKRKRDT